MTKLLLLGIGVSEKECDGVKRFKKFCNNFDIKYIVLGEGRKWNGGDMNAGPGGGQKVNEVKNILNSDILYQDYKMNPDDIIIICDTFDLYPVSTSYELLDKYNTITNYDNSKLLISSEVFCWPNKSMSNDYPKCHNKYRYLNSGCIMGTIDKIKKLLNSYEIKDFQDDQLFYAQRYLSSKDIILDHNCQLFQTVNGVADDLRVYKNRIYNTYAKSYPVLIHGNGPAKMHINSYENYLNIQNFTQLLEPEYVYKLKDYPKIFVAYYCNSKKNSFDHNNLEKLTNYPKTEIHIYDDNDSNTLKEHFGDKYHFNNPDDKYYYEEFLRSDCDYYLLLHDDYKIENLHMLNELVGVSNNNIRVISPMFEKINTYRNFWGSIKLCGNYLRSHDYLDIANRTLIGLWNVPYVTGCILIRRDVIENYDLNKINPKPKNYFDNDRDIKLCKNLRDNSMFMYLINVNKYGLIL